MLCILHDKTHNCGTEMLTPKQLYACWSVETSSTNTFSEGGIYWIEIATRRGGIIYERSPNPRGLICLKQCHPWQQVGQGTYTSKLMPPAEQVDPKLWILRTKSKLIQLGMKTNPNVAQNYLKQPRAPLQSSEQNAHLFLTGWIIWKIPGVFYRRAWSGTRKWINWI